MSNTDDLGRKVWDTKLFEGKAKEREVFGEVEIADADTSLVTKKKKRKVRWTIPINERKDLEKRELGIDLASDLNKSRVVTQHTEARNQGGFWCEVCECLLKDSQAYLDHVNGKNHNRMIGRTLKVATKTVSDVDDVINQLVAKSTAPVYTDEEIKAKEIEDMKKRIHEAENLQTRRKRRRKEKKVEQKVKKLKEAENEGEDEFTFEDTQVPWLQSVTGEAITSVKQVELAKPVESDDGEDI